MAGRQLAAVILIVAGVPGLLYGGFSYTKETHEAKIGPLQFSIKEKETVNIPVWAGTAAIGAGVVVLLIGRTQALACHEAPRPYARPGAASRGGCSNAAAI
jgi:hypothetical protein